MDGWNVLKDVVKKKKRKKEFICFYEKEKKYNPLYLIANYRFSEQKN